MTVTIVDYGLGNILSVQRALEYCGAQVILATSPEQISKASKIILPGVGAFGRAMQELNQRELVQPLTQRVQEGVSLLGICLGMQLLFNESLEMGRHQGLGFVSGKVVPIPRLTTTGQKLKIPHVGWNDSVYFVHSFQVIVDDPKAEASYCEYGGHRIAATVRKENIFGCQFHPEKSGPAGLKILKAWIND